MYLYEFDKCAAVCAHHVIFAAFHRHKRHSSIVVLVQGIQASADAHVDLEEHSASTDDQPPAGHIDPGKLPAAYCKLQSHNLYFLKRKIITSNIYGAFLK